jgi:hypothetical protein
MRTLLTLLACSVAVRAQFVDPKLRFQRRLEAVQARAAGIHVELAKLSAARGLHGTAWREMRRAARLDPSNVEAHLAIGLKLVDGSWVPDPQASVATENAVPFQDLGVALAAYRHERRLKGVELSGDFDSLADFALECGLPDRAEEMWRLALRYNPHHARALSRLGWTRADALMIPPSRARALEMTRKEVSELAGGRIVGEASPAEKAAGWTLSKRESANFRFEGMFTDGEVRSLLRWAEAARSLFVKTFEVPEESLPGPLSGYFLRHQGDHAVYLEKVLGLGDLERIALRDAPWHEEFGPDRFEVWRGERPFEYLRAAAVHLVVRHHFRDLTRMDRTPAWLATGVSAWFADRLLGYGQPCFVATSSQRTRDTTVTHRWRRLVREWAWEGTSPRIRALARTSEDKLTFEQIVKAWSLVDWLLTKRRDCLYDFLARCREGSSGKALRLALGATSYDELELRWEEFVDADE